MVPHASEREPETITLDQLARWAKKEYKRGGSDRDRARWFGHMLTAVRERMADERARNGIEAGHTFEVHLHEPPELPETVVVAECEVVESEEKPN